MKLASVLLATVLAGASLAQTINAPECAKRCFETAGSNRGCHVPVEYSCLCVLSPISNDFYQCLDRRCSPADQDVSRKIVNRQCGRGASSEPRDAPKGDKGTVSGNVDRSRLRYSAPWEAMAKTRYSRAATRAPATKRRSNQQPQAKKKVLERVFSYITYGFLIFTFVVAVFVIALNKLRTVLNRSETATLPRTEPKYYLGTNASADEASSICRGIVGLVGITFRGRLPYRKRQHEADKSDLSV